MCGRPVHLPQVEEDTEELAVLGLGAHAAELLLVATEAPGVVAYLLRAQAAVPVQHLEGQVQVNLGLQAWTLQLGQVADVDEVQRQCVGLLVNWLLLSC